MPVVVKIEGEGLNFSFTTNIRRAGQIISFLGTNDVDNGQIISISPSEASESQLLPVAIKNKSPRQVLMDSKARTNSQKIAVLGFYYCELNNTETFPSSELRVLFGKAGEAIPRNFARDIKEAVNSNYIFENRVGEYLVTEFAKESIGKGFTDSPSQKKPSRSATNKKGLTEKIVSAEVKSLELDSVFDEYPSYWELPLKGERILWLFVYADKNGIVGLSSTEVEFLAGRLRDSIPTKNFNGLTYGIFKKGFLIKSGEKYKILQPGIEYLRAKKAIK